MKYADIVKKYSKGKIVAGRPKGRMLSHIESDFDYNLAENKDLVIDYTDRKGKRTVLKYAENRKKISDDIGKLFRELRSELSEDEQDDFYPPLMQLTIMEDAKTLLPAAVKFNINEFSNVKR